jgi:cell division protease FtsH
MSEEMGPIEYGENQEEVFLGRSVTQTQSVSEEVAQKIDKEIRKLIDEGYNQATKILTEKIDDLHKIAKALITYETLTGEEIENIINKNIYPKDKIAEKPEDNDDQSSALGAMGLKPKIVH